MLRKKFIFITIVTIGILIQSLMSFSFIIQNHKLKSQLSKSISLIESINKLNDNLLSINKENEIQKIYSRAYLIQLELELEKCQDKNRFFVNTNLCELKYITKN